MTTIVGMVTKNGVVIGGDKLGTYAKMDLISETPSKLVSLKPSSNTLIIGITGELKSIMALRISADGVPKHKTSDSDELYLQKYFYRWLMELWKEYGQVENDNEGRSYFPVSALISYKRALWEMDSYGGFQDMGKFWAVGSGTQIAIGALAMVTEGDEPIAFSVARERVHRALIVSSRYSSGTRGPFDILECPLSM